MKNITSKLTDELPPSISAAYHPIEKQVYLNCSLASKHKNQRGGNRLHLAHEYTHMLFDLLPKESQDKIVEKVIAHSNYSKLKELVTNLGYNEKENDWDTKNDRRVVGEILAIRSDFRRRAAYEKAAGNDISCVDYFLELVEPIAEGYIDNLGFNKPVSAAKAKHRELELIKQ